MTHPVRINATEYYGLRADGLATVTINVDRGGY